ncbi:QWRF family [Vigna unguiculata]|uniref:QWRF family n=1 Tax=Vigna unguiculata TaxID=3917 RepID=A0A4D6KTH4_VIGUN|nr:QWRF family [Vigna unguiculata]
MITILVGADGDTGLETPPKDEKSIVRVVSLRRSSRGVVSRSRSKPSTPPKGGGKGATLVEDAHQLRLLYNKYLQWRFTNTEAEDVFYFQNAKSEGTTYGL